MPLPTGADQHVNSLLTNLSVMFVNDPGKFVAPQAFPPVPVMKQTGIIPQFDRADFLRDEAQVRAPASESAGGGYRVDNTATYNCLEYAYHKNIADQDRANADDPYAPDRNAVAYLNQKRLLREEVQWASNYFTTGVWTGSSTATDLVAGTDFTAWDDAASDIVGIIDNEAEAIEAATAMYPNLLVLNRAGWNTVKNHPDIVDRVKHVSDGPVTPDIVARLLGIERILVGAAVKATSGEGASTTTTAAIFGKHALLCYAAPTPSLELPSAGYTFRWTPVDGGEGGAAVSTYRMDLRRADRHEIDFAFDQKVISAVCGAFFQNVCS